jgi:hypothetical protein
MDTSGNKFTAIKKPNITARSAVLEAWHKISGTKLSYFKLSILFLLLFIIIFILCTILVFIGIKIFSALDYDVQKNPYSISMMLPTISIISMICSSLLLKSVIFPLFVALSVNNVTTRNTAIDWKVLKNYGSFILICFIYSIPIILIQILSHHPPLTLGRIQYLITLPPMEIFWEAVVACVVFYILSIWHITEFNVYPLIYSGHINFLKGILISIEGVFKNFGWIMRLYAISGLIIAGIILLYVILWIIAAFIDSYLLYIILPIVGFIILLWLVPFVWNQVGIIYRETFIQ